MNRLFENLPRLQEVKDICFLKDSKYFSHTYINNRPINENTISVIMTSSNRSKQVYYTLFTFLHSIHKDIHVVLVDDSDSDCVVTSILEKFPFAIDFIQINRNNKFWINPCVNYNLAFQYSKGSKIILQNSEVCHVGDIFSYVTNKINNNEYHVFDVKTCAGYSSNDFLYDTHDPLTIEIYNVGIYSQWYQHSYTGDRQLHFLVAFTQSTFETFGGFSFDYAFSGDYDDDDLLLLIKSHNIEVKSIAHETNGIGGIHLYHTLSVIAWTQRTSNDTLFQKKKEYCNQYPGEYLEVSKGNTLEEYLKRFIALHDTKKI